MKNEAESKKKKESLAFQAEVSKLLDLVANSLYSEREIFLREYDVVSNKPVLSGIFPVIGLPFPFISYGGSFLVSCFIIIAIINNIVNNDM